MIKERTNFLCGNLNRAMNVQFPKARWGDDCLADLRCSFSLKLPGLGAGATVASIKKALALWTELFQLNLRLLPNFTKSAHVWGTCGPLPGGAIAWSMLPSGSCTENIEQRYDTLERWNSDLLIKVCCHEVGHALGLRHTNDRNSIMYPSVGEAMRPNETDIQKMVKLGYKRRQDDEPDNPDLPPDSGIEVSGRVVVVDQFGIPRKFKLVPENGKTGGPFWPDAT